MAKAAQSIAGVNGAVEPDKAEAGRIGEEVARETDLAGILADNDGALSAFGRVFGKAHGEGVDAPGANRHLDNLDRRALERGFGGGDGPVGCNGSRARDGIGGNLWKRRGTAGAGDGKINGFVFHHDTGEGGDEQEQAGEDAECVVGVEDEAKGGGAEFDGCPFGAQPEYNAGGNEDAGKVTGG